MQTPPDPKEDPKKEFPPAAWIGVGVALGAGIGVSLNNIAIGIGIGIAFGVVMMAVMSRSQKN